MAQKNNIRSIRFSDELAELIDRQVGRTFTEKFENLVTRCVWELPGKEAELKRLDQEINRKRKELQQMTVQAAQLGATINRLFLPVKTLEEEIQRATAKWKAEHKSARAEAGQAKKLCYTGTAHGYGRGRDCLRSNA